MKQNICYDQQIRYKSFSKRITKMVLQWNINVPAYGLGLTYIFWFGALYFPKKTFQKKTKKNSPYNSYTMKPKSHLYALSMKTFVPNSTQKLYYLPIYPCYQIFSDRTQTLTTSIMKSHSL